MRVCASSEACGPARWRGVSNVADIESWTEYRLLIVTTLERLESAILKLRETVDQFRKDDRAEVDKLRAEVVALRIEFGMQRIKIAVIGAAASLIVSGIISYFVKHS